MSPWVLGFGLCVALGPALVLFVFPEFSASFEGVRLAAFTWCVGALFLSLPRVGPAPSPRGALVRAVLVLGVFAPSLALALALDRAASLALGAGLGIGLVAAWIALCAAAELAHVRGRLGPFAALWCVLLLGLPLLRASLLWAGRPDTAAAAGSEAWWGALESLAQLSPLAHVYTWAKPGSAVDLCNALGPALVLVALLVAAGFGPRRRTRGAGAGAKGAAAKGVGAAGVLGALVVLVPMARGDNRLHWAELELRGPLREVTLTLERGGSTVLELDLGPGQTSRLEVPLGYRSALERSFLPLPSIAAVGGGEARWLDVVDPSSVTAPDPWAALPRGLTARPRPAPEQRRPGPGSAALALVLLAPAAGVWVFARRSASGEISPLGGAAGAGLGLAAAALLLGPLSTAAPGGNRVRGLELHGASALVLLAERGQLDPEGAQVLRLEVRPEGADIRIVARPAPGQTRARWQVEDPTGALEFCAFAPGPPGAAALVGERNDLETLNGAVWRSPGGEWHGPWTWRRGEPTPAALTALLAGEGPTADADVEALVLRSFPGWLVGGLPQGVGVLVASLEPGPDGAPRWLRLTPFR